MNGIEWHDLRLGDIVECARHDGLMGALRVVSVDRETGQVTARDEDGRTMTAMPADYRLCIAQARPDRPLPPTFKYQGLIREGEVVVEEKP